MLLLLALLQDPDVALRGKIDALTPPKGATAAILVVSRDRELYAKNTGEPMTPASNTKLFTTAAALSRLGEKYRFETRVYVIDGALHVVAGGDPNLSGRFHDGDPTAVFKGWAAKLKAAGIEQVGDLVLHDTRGDAVDLHPDWKDYAPGAWWNAPVSWFSLNDNCIDATLAPAAREGDPAAVTLSPATRYVEVVNTTTTVAKVAKGQEAIYAVRPGAIAFSRQIALKARPPTWSIAVDDPTAFFGTVLSETLTREGIRVTGKVVRKTDDVKGTPLTVTTSDLPRTLQVTNTRSQNLYAELLARHVAVAAGKPATFEEAGKAVTAYAKSLGAEQTKLVDGSGLSANNRTCVRDIMAVLKAMRGNKVFFDSLAVSGGDEGTLKERMTKIKGRVHAKTGTIDGVDALSGYVDTRRGDTLIFSMLLNGQKNHDEARAFLDAVCEAIVEY